MAESSKPAPYEWKKIAQTGDVPSARSGHTLSWVGGQTYLLYGGVEDGKNGKIQPDPDIYMMKLANDKCNWYKEQLNGDERPLARSQHVSLTTPKNDKVFVFGGHHSPQTRLNDTWMFHVKDLEWRRIGEKKDKENTTNQPSDIGGPGPRANMGSCLFKNKIWVFGGHGGLNYQRIAYNDLYSFDLETETWEKHIPNGSPPDGRGGHSLFAVDGEAGDKLFVYGGWNQEMQYNNIWQYDFNTKEWSDPDIFNEVPRWNHCSLLIEAIPTWKFFIFGGECAEYNEGAARSFGQYVNSSCFIDLGAMRWSTFASDIETQAVMPKPREYAAMTYDNRDQRLIVLGGWHNGWLDDLYTLKVAKIVGPSYAIMKADPALGQLSGNVQLVIIGQGFKEVNINVHFTCGSRPVDVIS